MTEGHLDGISARNTTIALQWDEIGLQSLADHMVANQNFHGGIKIHLKEAQGMEICNTDGTRVFLQKDLTTYCSIIHHSGRQLLLLLYLFD